MYYVDGFKEYEENENIKLLVIQNMYLDQFWIQSIILDGRG